MAAKKKATPEKKAVTKKKRKNTTSKATAKNLERQEVALKHRKKGLSHRKIGKLMGISGAHVHRLVVAALKDSTSRIETNADNLRDLELERLDTLQEALSEEAGKGSPQAVEKTLKVMEQRQRLAGIVKPIEIFDEQLKGDGDGERKLTVTVQYV